MKAPLSWLADHLAELPPLDALRARLPICTTELEAVHERGLPATPENDASVVAGLVLEAGKHPNADRLQLCQLDTGESTPRQIVCGAWNFGTGDTVAVSLPGTVLRDGRKIVDSTLRGELSRGMILSEQELDLSNEHDGILVLGPGFAPGEPLVSRLPLRDAVLEIEVTSNRSDLLSMRGLAREIGAIFEIDLLPLDESEPPAHADGITASYVTVGSADWELCPRFTARVFQGVQIKPSPLWMRARLHAIDLRPISNIVDITNYVAHDLGQPLHAYDHAKIPGHTLTARRAKPGERVTTLDGQARELDESMLVIADADAVNGLAGLMGGANSEITEQTQTVVLEAATFARTSILRTSARLGLRTDASNRFEKGVDPNLPPIASRAAARLIVELAGGRMAARPLDVSGPQPEPAAIRMRMPRLAAITGMDVPQAAAVSILARLGFEPRAGQGIVDVRVPSPRLADVTREIDVIEEVARIHGLDRVPSLAMGGARTGGLTPNQALRRLLADACAGAGLNEALTLSYVAPDAADRLDLAAGDPRRAGVELANPLSRETAQMRTLITPSLLEVIARNRATGTDDVALFEIAHTYHPEATARLPREPWVLAAALCGKRGGGWRESAGPVNFFLTKGVLDTVLSAAGVSCTTVPGDDPFLHPGRRARVLVHGSEIGWLGELHPSIAERFGIDAPIGCFELDLDALGALRGDPPLEQPVSEFPALRQDIAVVLHDRHAAAAASSIARAAGGTLLADVAVFDVYRDAAALGADRRSLALRLTFQALDRTLSDDEVRPVRERITKALADALGAELRS